MGWAPRRRLRIGYYLPAEVYEGTLDKLVAPDNRWLDVGGGHSIFPQNPGLARELVERCTHVTAVDPSPNVLRNPFVHERVQSTLQDLVGTGEFDLATMRMVVEHVSDPDSFTQTLARLVRPGGHAVVLTVAKWSPISVVSRLVPFSLHHTIKSLFWGGEEEDTFPVHYVMNTPGTIRTAFLQAGFEEVVLRRLDDLSALGQFRWFSLIEVLAWRVCRTLRVPYPEHCLLAVFRRAAV